MKTLRLQSRCQRCGAIRRDRSGEFPEVCCECGADHHMELVADLRSDLQESIDGYDPRLEIGFLRILVGCARQLQLEQLGVLP